MKRGYKAEKERKDYLEKQGYIVYRVSGSMGAEDLIVLKRTSNHPSGLFRVWLEQVKSTKKKVFYFNARSIDEWNRLSSTDLEAYFVIKFRRGIGRKPVWKMVKVNRERPKKVVA